MTDKEKRIFDMQAESTKAALLRQKDRPPEDDWLYITRPIPESYLAVPDAKNLNELVACRPITHQEAKVEGTIRRLRGARIAQKRLEGEVTSVTEEKKERAVNAFMDMFTPDIVKMKFKEIFGKAFKPSYAEIVAEEIKKRTK